MVFSAVHWNSANIRQNLWIIILFAGVFLACVRHYATAEATDPHHCKAITRHGKWLVTGPKLKNWQAPNCMLHHYQAKDVSKCLKDKRVLFMGDNTARQAFYGAARAVNSSIEDPATTLTEIEQDVIAELNGVSYEFYWDPFMTQGGFEQLRNASASSTVAMAYIAFGQAYAENMPGEEGPQKFGVHLETLKEALLGNDRYGTIMVSPVIQPYAAKLNKSLVDKLDVGQVHALNAHIETKFKDTSVYVPTVFNMLPADREDSFGPDGTYLNKDLSNIQADIFYNLRCNNKISDHFPYANTCCMNYKTPSGLYFIVVAMCLVGIPGLIFSYYYSSMTANIDISASTSQLYGAIITMCIGLGYCYLTDRTQIFAKGNKNFLTEEFGLLSLLSVVAGFVAITKSEDAKSTGFLNRHMTDEWKGWMQIAILIYHITGGSKVLNIYKLIRVMVASYLFMTGYGHTAFFTSKGDFGVKRVLSVLCRINLLTIFLAYVMNTNYIFYYFSPLVSFWFGIIWITFRILPQFNAGLKGSLIKVLLSAIAVFLFVKVPGPMESIFWVLKTFARIEWDLKEWRFRVMLDIWAVHFGMLVSIFANNPELTDLRAGLSKYKTAWFSFGVFLSGVYWLLASMYDVKAQYNAHHSYLSILGISGYILIRNGFSFLTNRHSRVFGWFGKISLETFILQFHIWMAADTAGVLYILDMGVSHDMLALSNATYGPRKIANFVLTTVIFLLVSEKVASASGVLTTLIVTPDKFIAKPTTPATSGGTDEEAQSLTDEKSTTVRRLGGKLGLAFYHLMMDIRFRMAFIMVVLYVANILW